MERTITQELRTFETCPKCKNGNMIHVDHYFCNQDGCNFWIPKQAFGIKITKAMMGTLVKQYVIQPMYTGVQLPKDDGFITVNAFLILDPKDFQVKLRFPNQLPIANCPKCKQEYVIMKYSERNDSLYYGCRDYKGCKFTLPYNYANRHFNFKDIKKLCGLQSVSKELQAKKTLKKYTVSLFLNEKFQLEKK